MSLTKVTNSMLASPTVVSVFDYLSSADAALIKAGTLTGQDKTAVTAAIQSALDSSADGITVDLGGKGYAYATNGNIVITGSYKVLDGQGASINPIFTDGICINIHPLAAETQLFAGAKNITLWGQDCIGNANEGVRISGKSYNAQTDNLFINYFGLGKTGGYGFHVVGGVGGGNAPYFGNHVNIKCNQCYNGFIIEGANATDVLTTNNFTNCYAATSAGIGMYMLYCTGNTLINYSAESNVGPGLQLSYVNGLYAQGGFIEGNTPNVTITNSGASIANTLNFGVSFASATTANYSQLPNFYISYGDVALKKVGIPLIDFNTNDILPFASHGKVIVMDRFGPYCEYLLTDNGVTKAVEILTTGSVGSTYWTTTKGTAASFNLYWSAANNQYEFESTRSSTVMSFQYLVECS
jgi:hypothetical protein